MQEIKKKAESVRKSVDIIDSVWTKKRGSIIHGELHLSREKFTLPSEIMLRFFFSSFFSRGFVLVSKKKLRDEFVFGEELAIFSEKKSSFLFFFSVWHKTCFANQIRMKFVKIAEGNSSQTNYNLEFGNESLFRV